jgi:hypothetical protein
MQSVTSRKKAKKKKGSEAEYFKLMKIKYHTLEDSHVGRNM